MSIREFQEDVEEGERWIVSLDEGDEQRVEVEEKVATGATVRYLDGEKEGVSTFIGALFFERFDGLA